MEGETLRATFETFDASGQPSGSGVAEMKAQFGEILIDGVVWELE